MMIFKIAYIPNICNKENIQTTVWSCLFGSRNKGYEARILRAITSVWCQRYE